MTYLIIMGSLVAAAVLLIVIIVVALTAGRDVQDDFDDNEEEDEEEAAAVQKPCQKKNPPQRSESARDHQTAGTAHRKKQWKIILENLESWERITFVFYDNIGIGRVRSEGEFDRFLVLNDDRKVSKLHCEIVRKDDRLYLRDLGSRNGTYLNGELIDRPVLIQKEDIIGVGGTKIEVKKVLREKD